jgi:antitoxin component YwqK of YwqJK toxin-antitoxin module
MQKLYTLCNRAGLLIAICLFSLTIFSSCNKNKPDPNLIEIKDGLICSIYNGKPFTGTVSDVVDKQKVEYDVVKGIKEGDFNVFSENGIKIISGEIKNNMNDGLWQYFYPNGQLESRGYFRNDKVSDEWVWYFPDGKIKAIGHYVNGKKDGKWTIYSQSGRILSDKIFRNDKILLQIQNASV